MSPWHNPRWRWGGWWRRGGRRQRWWRWPYSCCPTNMMSTSNQTFPFSFLHHLNPGQCRRQAWTRFDAACRENQQSSSSPSQPGGVKIEGGWIESMNRFCTMSSAPKPWSWSSTLVSVLLLTFTSFACFNFCFCATLSWGGWTSGWVVNVRRSSCLCSISCLYRGQWSGKVIFCAIIFAKYDR